MLHREEKDQYQKFQNCLTGSVSSSEGWVGMIDPNLKIHSHEEHAHDSGVIRMYYMAAY